MHDFNPMRFLTSGGNRPKQNPPVVCQLLHSLNIGGAEVLAARLASGLAGKFRFVFACLDEVGSLGKDLRDRNFVVESIGRRPGIDLTSAFRLAKFVKREGVDLIHAHQYTPFVYGMMSGLLGRPPILFNEHGRFHPDYRSAKRVAFNRLMLRKRDRVVAVGNSVRQALIDNEGIHGSRIRTIYNGIDLSSRDDQRHLRDHVRNELNIPLSSFVLIQVARLDKIKDHATAIRTLARIESQNPDARLVIVGEGPARPTIETEIHKHELQSKVLMTGERRDVTRLLSAADAFLLTSVSEGIPVTLIEAMAAFVPVISTSVGGVGEVVIDNETGLLAPAGDDRKLAEHALRLSVSPELAQRLRESGRQRAESLFSESTMHTSYAELYHDMLLGNR